MRHRTFRCTFCIMHNIAVKISFLVILLIWMRYAASIWLDTTMSDVCLLINKKKYTFWKLLSFQLRTLVALKIFSTSVTRWLGRVSNWHSLEAYKLVYFQFKRRMSKEKYDNFKIKIQKREISKFQNEKYEHFKKEIWTCQKKNMNISKGKYEHF